MKKTHIALIILIAISIGAIISATGDFSTYVGFHEANEQPGTKYTVIGQLDTTKSMNYDPLSSTFSFVAVDKDGNSSRVHFHEPKPQDFERSEEITMKGYAKDSVFVAEEILMKCPSKYNENNQLGDYETY
tara:strand:+ start:357 stop:749 length:393 start_codon:yes stop_codon:yes gene_type:complete